VQLAKTTLILKRTKYNPKLVLDHIIGRHPNSSQQLKVQVYLWRFNRHS